MNSQKRSLLLRYCNIKLLVRINTLSLSTSESPKSNGVRSQSQSDLQAHQPVTFTYTQPIKMKLAFIILLVQCLTGLVASEEPSTRDLEDSEDLERKHRKRKKGQNNSPCGGYGRTFFGHDTYVSAPVMNYFFGCGVAALPVAPVAPIAPVPFPINIGVSQSQSGYHHHGGHGGHGGGHGGHGGFGGHGGLGGHGGQGGLFGGNPNIGFGGPSYGIPGNFGGYNSGFTNLQQPYQSYNQGAYQRPYNRPLQNVVSAAASGLGNALADYVSNRPRKTYKQINKQVNQFLRPLYKLF